MLIQYLLAALVILIVASAVAEPVARWVRLPFVAMLVVMGFLGSELMVGLGLDTGIRFDNFNQMVMYVFIPIIIFESAYRIPLDVLRRNLLPVIMLAMPIMLISTFVAALLLFWGIGHSVGFPLISALIAGTLLAATDPMATVSHLKQIKAPKDITTTIEGESLFNDALAVVVFTSLIELALNVQNQPVAQTDWQWLPQLWSFVITFIGGLTVGVFCGALGAFFSYVIQTRILENVLLVSVAYGAFLVAEDLLGVSGILAVLFAGITMSLAHNKFIPETDRVFIQYWWEVLSFFANAMIFILLGVTITVTMFDERWLAMLIAIGAVLITRAVAVFGLLPLMTLGSRNTMTDSDQKVLFWGSTRGAVTVALALSLPTALEGWYTIQSMAFGVVLFTLFVQAPTIPRLLRRTHPKHTASHINLRK